MKRVAFFLPHFEVGGAEMVILRLLQGLDRTAFQPVLILQTRRGALLDRLPTDVAVLDLGGARASRAVLPLSRLLRREGFDLTYTATNATNLLMLAALRLARVQTRAIVSEHTPLTGFLGHAKARTLRTLAMKALYRDAAMLAAPLPQIGKEHGDLLGRMAPFHVLPNPVIDSLPVLPRPASCATRLVSVGRLAEEKRFDLMIRAFAAAHAENPDLRLTIHGEGPARPALEQLIQTLGLTDTVTLPGRTDDVPAALEKADLFLCTSRLEGLGNAIIEAMGAGVPVLSVDCPFGPAHLLEQGNSGMLMASDCPDAIAQEILRLVPDAPRRTAYQTRARKMAQRYTIPAAVAAYEGCFTRALA